MTSIVQRAVIGLGVAWGIAVAGTIHGAALELDDFYGPVTEAEIERFKSVMSTFPLPESNVGNDLTYGDSAERIISLGKLYELTGDRAFLDRMIVMADHMLAARNDEQEGRVIWTGQRDPVWPNRSADDEMAKLVEAEQGESVGHIAYCARIMLEAEAIADDPVPDGDPFGFGQTYRERAEFYVEQMDRTIEAFILPHFVDDQTLRFYRPDAQGWKDLGERQARDAGDPVPWNQQSKLANGFQRMAQCHEMLGSHETARHYDRIVQTALEWFIREALIERVTDEGQIVVKWPYGGTGDRYIDGTFGHGQASVQMLVRAYESDRYNVPEGVMLRLADTLIHSIAADNEHAFHKRVDGTGQTSRRRGLINLSHFDKLVYHLNLAATDFQEAFSSPLTYARYLRIKDRYAQQDHPVRDSSASWLDLTFDEQGNQLRVDVELMHSERPAPISQTLEMDYPRQAGVVWEQPEGDGPALRFESAEESVERADHGNAFGIDAEQDFRVAVTFKALQDDAQGPLLTRQRSDRATWHIQLDGSDLRLRTWGPMHRDIREGLDMNDVIEPETRYTAVFERENGQDISLTLYDESGQERATRTSQSAAASGCERAGNRIALGADTQDNFLSNATIYQASVQVGEQQLEWPAHDPDDPKRVLDRSVNQHHGRFVQERGHLRIELGQHELFDGPLPRVDRIRIASAAELGGADVEQPVEKDLTFTLTLRDEVVGEAVLQGQRSD